MRRLSLHLLLIASSALSGCANQVWFRSGASANDFYSDRAQCNVKAFSIPGASLQLAAMVQHECLVGKGWRLVDETASRSDGPKTQDGKSPDPISQYALALSRQRYEQTAESRCSSSEFAGLFKKTSCKSEAIVLSQMRLTEKLSKEDEPVFVKWRSEWE